MLWQDWVRRRQSLSPKAMHLLSYWGSFCRWPSSSSGKLAEWYSAFLCALGPKLLSGECARGQPVRRRKMWGAEPSHLSHTQGSPSRSAANKQTLRRTREHSKVSRAIQLIHSKPSWEQLSPAQSSRAEPGVAETCRPSNEINDYCYMPLRFCKGGTGQLCRVIVAIADWQHSIHPKLNSPSVNSHWLFL